MTVALARDVKKFLQTQMRFGVCTDASELVNDVIRSIRERQRRPLGVRHELESWLLEAADKLTTPLINNDFSGIRERVRARQKSSGT